MKLTLVNTSTNDVIAEILDGEPLPDGILGNPEISIVAEPDDPVGSVTFTFGSYSWTENFAPYAMFGDSRGSFLEPDFTPFSEAGDYTISVTAYAGSDGSGSVVESLDYTVSVADEAPASAPMDDMETETPVDMGDTPADAPMDVDGAMQMDMAEMVIEDNNAYLMAMGEGSRIEIHAADKDKESWSQLETTAEAGSNTITVNENTGWEIGDKIAIASTSNNWEHSEEFTILEISEDGTTITLDGVLEHSHQGETVSYDNGQTGEEHREWDVEIRAEVALLSRNVTIQGDADSVEDGFGGHTMVMDGAEQHIEGAEFYRMGQEDILGRYPIHWHMLGDAEGQYVSNVSVHESYQKGSTIHGTSKITYEDNVIYDHVGHGLFLEDGSENDNLFLGNLVFNTKESLTGEPIPTDGEHVSSYWIENPNNAFIGNHAAGSESNGFWIFEGQLHGLSEDTYVGDPGQLHDLVFIGNAGHSTSGDGGAGGTDKILGIDGAITNNLDFRQSTLAAEFGVVEGFTAYSGAVWNLTHEMVFNDSSFTDVRFFARHENFIENTVFDDSTVILYRDGGNQYDDVYAVDGTRFIQLSSDHVNTQNALNNVVLEDGSRLQFSGGQSGGTVNQQVSVDIDGAITGIPGAFITENDPFKAGPDAISVDGVAGLVSAHTIGATEVTALGTNGTVRVVRSDGESVDDLPTSGDSRRQGDDNEDRSDANYEFHTTAGLSQDLAYLIDFEDVPQDLTLNLANVREGESVTYEVQNITAIGDVTGGVEVGSLGALVRSDQTAYLHDGDSLYIRIVADRVEVQDERPVEDLLADYRAFGKIEVSGLVEGSNGNAGNREISDELIGAIETMPEREELGDPEPAAAAVDPNSSYIAYNVQMTEAQAGLADTNAKASFELNYDVGTRTVSISGEFSDLSSAATMVHLHGADDSVISGLTLDSNDGVNGTFAGSFTLSAAEAQEFLADETYVNLHTQTNPSGELRGDVEVYAAGDFVLDRYESTSDTTEVTAEMARWSDAATWDNGVPGVGDTVVIGPGETVVLDQSANVGGIIVNGGELLVEDMQDLALSSDYVLVINGGLFQVGTEDTPFVHEFDLTLEGDDPNFDLDVAAYVNGEMGNTVMAMAGSVETPIDPVEESLEEPLEEPVVEPVAAPVEEPLEEPVEEPIAGPIAAPVEEPAEEPVEEPVQEPVEEPAADQVTFSIFLVDTQTDAVIARLEEGLPLPDSVLGQENVSLMALTSEEVGSVALSMNGDARVENVTPYALFGDRNGDYMDPDQALFTEAGSYDLQLTAYAEKNAGGDVLGTRDVTFSFAEEEQTLAASIDETPVYGADVEPEAEPAEEVAAYEYSDMNSMLMKLLQGVQDAQASGQTLDQFVEEAALLMSEPMSETPSDEDNSLAFFI